jgi:hypothetical protein
MRFYFQTRYAAAERRRVSRAAAFSELREDKGSDFGHVCYHLASALFFTGCRYYE